MITTRKLLFGGFLFCFSLFVAALYMQHVMELEPCPLCILQRVLVMVTGIFFLIAAIHNPAKTGTKIYAGLIGLTALLGAAVSARHVWLQSLPADQVPSCGPGMGFIMENFPLTDALSMVLSGSGECAEISWTFLTLSIPAWTLLTFVGMLGLAIAAAWRQH
ncbi:MULTISPECIES: disulfide bond formation protein B [unclassified Methylophaga]|uniref:disulfide bond formation protein B n=1 Tax=unclassified Methylophaga TaxID=2629249 RepID=UPI000C634629|nr:MULTISPECIES: disulfide bond formation protein B [unclassified Methylophaga]MAL48291.1 disulfide bond formation protein B [Methylophaga sp.]MBP24380.1 disulfide bond formation protein B [Methylophaga sp.]